MVGNHNVFINGDVTVDKDMAFAGDVITVTGNKVGFTTNFKVYTTVDGTEQLVEVAVTNGIITGYPDGTFKPDKTVTRAEFSKMINSAVKLTAVGADITRVSFDED